MFEKLENYFIAQFNRQDAYVYSRYKMVLRASILTSAFSFSYLILSFVVQYAYGTYLMTFNVLGFLLLPFMMKTRISIKLIGNLYVLIGTIAVVIVIYFSGGVESPVLPWLIAPPVLALLVVNQTYAWVWTAVCVAAISYMVSEAMAGQSLPVLYNIEWKYTFVLLSSAGIILIVMVVGLIFSTNTSRALDEVEAQKKELHDQHEQITDNHARLTRQREELLATSEKLQELNSKKDFLLEILAHDLKSPLANIQGLLGIINSEGFQPNSLEKRVFGLITQSTKKSQDLIDKILSAENLEEVVYNLKLEQVNLDEVVQHVSDSLREEAGRKNIALHYMPPEPNNAVTLVDKVFTTQIFENLINNAIKFSPRETNVHVSMRVDDGVITTQIRDEGPGIPEEEMQYLFVKYRRLSNKPTGAEKSTGLGLSIVKHYAELMNGKIRCESELGKGTSFYVALPRG